MGFPEVCVLRPRPDPPPPRPQMACVTGEKQGLSVPREKQGLSVCTWSPPAPGRGSAQFLRASFFPDPVNSACSEQPWPCSRVGLLCSRGECFQSLGAGDHRGRSPHSVQEEMRKRRPEEENRCARGHMWRVSRGGLTVCPPPSRIPTLLTSGD